MDSRVGRFFPFGFVKIGFAQFHKGEVDGAVGVNGAAHEAVNIRLRAGSGAGRKPVAVRTRDTHDPSRYYLARVLLPVGRVEHVRRIVMRMAGNYIDVL